MTSRLRPTGLAWLILVSFAAFLAAVLPPEPVERRGALAALEACRLAYRRTGAFREVLEFTLTMPDGRREQKREEYGADRHSGAFLIYSTDGKETFRIVAREARIVATLAWVKDRYAEAPYTGDFAAALQRMGGAQAQLAAPPSLVARQGGDERSFLEALRLGVFGPIEVAGAGPVLAEDGSTQVAVELQAANGHETIRLDAQTHRFRELTAAFGEGVQQVRVSGRFSYFADTQLQDMALPELSARTAVGAISDLQADHHPAGEAPPNLRLSNLAGGNIRSEDLRGSVVVLDFWATWCVPCWTGLQHTAELASWAKASGLPVKVFAVDTLEHAGSLGDQRQRGVEFLRAKKLELPVLLDYDNKAFDAFHSPGLPSVIILDQAGRVARYHSGLLEDMVATLQKEVQDLLRPEP